jgi:hypothetical protein
MKRYNEGTPTNVWIGRGRFAVVDLSSGPVSYGVTDNGEGTVSIQSTPPITLRPSNQEDEYVSYSCQLELSFSFLTLLHVLIAFWIA